jgi:hypothetical protein
VIPEDIRQFVRSAIKSVWALELLLFIRRHAGVAWTVDRLTIELRSSQPLVADIVASFKKSGLIDEGPESMFQYHAASTELDALVARLERVYAETPIALVKEIVSAPNEKIQTFADAFKLKRD